MASKERPFVSGKYRYKKPALARQMPAKTRKNPSFKAGGKIYPDEIVLAVSVVYEDHVAATTVYASMDFDSKARRKSSQFPHNSVLT